MSTTRNSPDYTMTGYRGAPPSGGERRPPTLGMALRRYPMVFLLPIIIFAGVGVTLGQRRSPIFSASTQINVGVPNASTNATPGYAEAAQELASSYSREVTSRPIALAVSKQLNLRYAEVKQRVSSSAVPSSPTFYVNATGSTGSEAVTLAAATTAALRANIRAAQRASSPSRLLAAWRGLQANANALATAAGRLKGEVAGGHPVPAAKMQAAQLQAQTAELQSEAASERYTSAVVASAGPSLSVLNPARSATSDKTSITERYGIIGLAAGLIAGAALAFLTARLMTLWRVRTR